jgi:uncharacterized integral membrane protein (TIGR00698 family)
VVNMGSAVATAGGGVVNMGSGVATTGGGVTTAGGGVTTAGGGVATAGGGVATAGVGVANAASDAVNAASGVVNMGGGGSGARITIPWFALGFVAVTALNSLIALPVQLTAIATAFDTFVLAMAMAALGLTTHVSAIRNAGVRPLALAAVLFAWLIAGGVAINVGVTALLS